MPEGSHPALGVSNKKKEKMSKAKKKFEKSVVNAYLDVAFRELRLYLRKHHVIHLRNDMRENYEKYCAYRKIEPVTGYKGHVVYELLFNPESPLFGKVIYMKSDWERRLIH